MAEDWLVECFLCGQQYRIDRRSLNISVMEQGDVFEHYYMDGFPDEKNGLWGVVQELLGRKVDIPDLREKYKNVERVIVREEAE